MATKRTTENCKLLIIQHILPGPYDPIRNRSETEPKIYKYFLSFEYFYSKEPKQKKCPE